MVTGVDFRDLLRKISPHDVRRNGHINHRCVIIYYFGFRKKYHLK